MGLATCKGNVPSSNEGCKVTKSNTNAKIFNTTAWISSTSIFIYNNDSRVNLIADLVSLITLLFVNLKLVK